MIVLGLTGSIGMGKTTAAAMLESLGVPVHEADAEVHALLAPGGKAAIAVGAAFPWFDHPQLYRRRSIRRDTLGEIIFSDPEKREILESILHPCVREAQTAFIRKNRNMGATIVVLDIPLLFETGGENFVDYTIVVSAPPHVQSRRVLARPGMTEEKFRAILERQMPDGEKRARADYVIHTGLGRAVAMRELKSALADIRKKEKKKHAQDGGDIRPLPNRRAGKPQGPSEDARV